jgi:hypothetical protein
LEEQGILADKIRQRDEILNGALYPLSVSGTFQP